MKILVIGAAGRVGKRLIKYLSQTQHQVFGAVRKPEQQALISELGRDAMLVDLEKDISDITQGFDAVIFVAGSGGKRVQEVDYQGLVNTVQSAEQHGVKRFLYISSINIGKSRERISDEINAYYPSIDEVVPEKLLNASLSDSYHHYVAMKTLAEQAITSSKLNYTILRAGLLTEDDDAAEQVDVFVEQSDRYGKTARKNIAKCFIAALENENTYGKVYTVLDGETPINDIW